jgi:protein SCO1/2
MGMQRKLLWFSAAGLVGMVVLAAVIFLTRKPSFRGVEITPPLAAAEIELTDQNGNLFRLSDHRGEVVLLYFGYINCPDDCPLTTAHLKLAMEDLGPRARKVQVVMVSTDPVRDTPAGLKDFMAHFNPDFLGLTGTRAELEKVWGEYWVHVENGGETHGTSIFAIDPAGNIRVLFSPETEAEDISADVNLLIKGE